MAKKIIKKRGKMPPNIFYNGGEKQSWGQQSSNQFLDAFKGENLGGSIGGIGDAATSIAQAGMSNAQIADTSGIKAQNNAQRNMIVGASSNDDLMSEWSTWNKVNDNYSRKDIRGGSTGQRITNTLGATTSGATTGATVGGPIGAVVGGVVGLGSAIGGWISGGRKARMESRSLNRAAQEANERALSSFETKAENIDTQNDLNMLANFSAYGGPLEFGSGAIGYEFGNEYLNNQKMSALAKQRLTSLPNSFQALPEMNTYNAFAEGGGIHIKGKNRGKFNAQNVRNWNAFGGWLNTHGGDFTNGVTFIDEGGSHEENPNQGIQIGVDPEGTPNLVEEGEVVYDDYVFSDRMEIPDNIRKEYKLRGNTFAKAAKSAQKESEERPNDPISKRGLMSAMTRLQQAQEQVRIEENRGGNKYAHGGKMGRKYDGTGSEPNLIQFYTPQEKLLRKLQRNGVVSTYKPLDFQKPYSMMSPLERKEKSQSQMKFPPLVDKRTPDERWVDENIKPIQFNPSDFTGDKGNDTDPLIQGRGLTRLRYAPIVGSGLASLSDIFSKPDYSGADMISGVDLGAEAAGYAPIGNYLSYKPLDRDFYINKMNQQAAATRRGLMNTSGGNRLNAQAGILAADYNYGQNLGTLARQAEEYNQQQKERVEGFNRQTNMFNTETGLKSSMFNAESRNAAKRARLSQATTAAQMRQAIKDQDSARRSANITNFLQGLGDMGWENVQSNWLDELAKSGVLKMNTKGEYTGGTEKANGGKVKTKKKKGLTYG